MLSGSKLTLKQFDLKIEKWGLSCFSQIKAAVFTNRKRHISYCILHFQFQDIKSYRLVYQAAIVTFSCLNTNQATIALAINKTDPIKKGAPEKWYGA